MTISPSMPCWTRSPPLVSKPWRSAREAIRTIVTVLSMNSSPTAAKPKPGRKNLKTAEFASPLSVVMATPFILIPSMPYWKEQAKYAREHGIKRLAFEMHPNFAVYNPRTLMKLREAVGEEIGANCDLSHLFWQGCDPVEVIHFLGKQGALFHAHMKDTVFFPENLNRFGVLNFAFETNELDLASETFRAVGYGHSASLWKSVVKAYMDVGFEGILSIENEDPILAGEVGVERAAYVLKNVRNELLGV